MRILQLVHSSVEPPFNNRRFYERRGDEVETLDGSSAPDFPDPRRYAAAIVYGGAMSAFDDAGHPWIAAELRFLESCLRSCTPVLGLCLGSQLLARLLGARVYRSPAPEFGFKRILLNAAGLADPALGPLGRDSADHGFLAIEWHEDAWDLPRGAELLASSAAWSNQAFRYGPGVLALQFHLEFTQAHLDEAPRQRPEELPADAEGEDPRSFAAPSGRLDEVARSMETLLRGFLDPLA